MVAVSDKNNYDGVAGFYDRLARLFFGRQWDRVHLAPLRHLSSSARILIVGGGTGFLLPHFSEGQVVDFVDLSGEMIRIAKSREFTCEVYFHQCDYADWQSTRPYDAIIFPFFLDSFHVMNLKRLIRKAKLELNEGGYIHVLDFQNGNTVQQFFVWLMYRFFRLTTNIESDRLEDIHGEIIDSGFLVQHCQLFFSGWVFYRGYKAI